MSLLGPFQKFAAIVKERGYMGVLIQLYTVRMLLIIIFLGCIYFSY